MNTDLVVLNLTFKNTDCLSIGKTFFDMYNLNYGINHVNDLTYTVCFPFGRILAEFLEYMHSNQYSYSIHLDKNI